jgi:hypothetical protein
MQIDVSREADCVRLVQDTVRAYGRLPADAACCTWFMADPPLGTARQATDADMSAKGQSWNPVAADH